MSIPNIIGIENIEPQKRIVLNAVSLPLVAHQIGTQIKNVINTYLSVFFRPSLAYALTKRAGVIFIYLKAFSHQTFSLAFGMTSGAGYVGSYKSFSSWISNGTGLKKPIPDLSTNSCHVLPDWVSTKYCCKPRIRDWTITYLPAWQSGLMRSKTSGYVPAAVEKPGIMKGITIKSAAHFFIWRTS